MLIPPPVQHEIATQAPLIAYVPTRLAPGWRYASWTTTGDILVITFAKAGKRIYFLVRRYHGNTCSVGSDKTFQMAGVKVYWNGSRAEQVAWRCIDHVQLSAVTSLPSNRFADVGLGRMAASGHRIRS